MPNVLFQLAQSLPIQKGVQKRLSDGFMGPSAISQAQIAGEPFFDFNYLTFY